MATVTVHLTPISKNAKTGPIPVSTTTATTCPTACPFRHDREGGCYAAGGPLAMHWRAVTAGKRGGDWSTFCESIAALPDGQLWRHNQAGDLPGDGETIDADKLAALADANKGRRGFTYTHYAPEKGGNLDAVRAANAQGFTVNLSGNSLSHADELKALGGAPVVAVGPADMGRKHDRKGAWLESEAEYRARVAVSFRTDAGHRATICPATFKDVSCATCGLCQNASESRPVVVFPAHGASAKRADKVASS